MSAGGRLCLALLACLLSVSPGCDFRGGDPNYSLGPDQFVPVETIPEILYFHQPTYPRFARQAGIEGTVWIQALVSKDGTVERALVLRSSGWKALDESALAAADVFEFRPFYIIEVLKN